jgi:hypothetical protein
MSPKFTRGALPLSGKSHIIKQMIYLLLKIYIAVAVIYFLFLLYQINQGLASSTSSHDVVTAATSALLWPRDIFFYISKR